MSNLSFHYDIDEQIWCRMIKCPCGYHEKLSFDNFFHTHWDVCPKCGGDKYDCEKVTAKQFYKVVGKRFFGLLNKHKMSVVYKKQ